MATVRTRDFYATVGVSEDATEDEIRAAYRKLAHRYHPDKTGGDKAAEETLKEINEAYDVLKNKDKRAKYDQERKFESQFGYAGYEDIGDAGFGGVNLADILGAAFGGRAHRQDLRRPGRDLEAGIRVTLNEVDQGASRRISLRRNERCADCSGTGGAPGTEPVTCRECNGAGIVNHSNGIFNMSRTCSACRGRGQSYSESCTACAGSGLKIATRDISVRIPAGIGDGARLRVAGEGEPGDPGAPNGDLYVRVEIAADPFFTREGRDLVCEVPVTMAEAALGAKVRVPTLCGVAELDVVPGTQSGTRLRMRGMGLPGLQGRAKGDQYVKIVVEVPRKLSAQQKRLLKEFDADYEPEANPLKKAFQSLIGRFRK